MTEPEAADQVRASERIYEGRVINLRRDTVALPDGGSACREVVEHRGAVAIVPVFDDGEVLLVKQYRHAVGEWLLEIPAGTLEAGEEPERCAARELQEETGYTATSFQHLLSVYVSPGYSNEMVHIFLAEGLTAGTAHPETDERIQVCRMPLSDAVAMACDGRIRDAKSVVALLFV